MADHDSPERDAELARQALTKNDLPQALHHIGHALSSNPVQPEWMQLLAQIIGASPDPLQLTEIESNPTVIDAANRAYALAWMRQWDDALDLITDAAMARPDVPYLLWCEWWMSQGAANELPWDRFRDGILVDLAKIAMRCPPMMAKDDPRRPNVECSARIIQLIRNVHGQQAFVWFTYALIARRLGSHEEGLQAANYAYQLEPAWRNAVAVANLYRDMKKLDDAVQWYKRALDHDKEDVSAYNDMGDMFYENNRYQDALNSYEQVLKKEPDNDWAKASVYFVRFKMTGDQTQRLCLLRMREAGDGSERASMLAEELDPPTPYMTYLPRPGDASCNALNHIFEQMYQNPASHANATVTLELSHLESPSVVAAFWLQMEMWGLKNPIQNLITLDYKARTIQQPDPRQPKAQVPYVLWAWDEALPRPNVAPPDAKIARAVQQIALEPFHFDIWLPLCEKLGRELGAAAVPNLLSTMVYPPKPTGGAWRVLNWTQRVQIAAALTIAHVDLGWAGSERQRALYSLAYGPSDWTVGAALVALGVIARKEPATRGDIEQVFAWLRTQVPAEGFCAWEYPLVCTYIAIAGPNPDLLAWKDKVENEVGKSTVHMAEIGAKKFDQQAEMQKAAAAQQQMAAGGGGDPDPLVFPGGKVPKLSDYVGLMKQMQAGNMMGALSALGLDMMQYATVAQQWGGKLAQDPVLNAKFADMMRR